MQPFSIRFVFWTPFTLSWSLSNYAVIMPLKLWYMCRKNWLGSTEDALIQDNFTLIFLGDLLLFLFLWHFLPWKQAFSQRISDVRERWQKMLMTMMTYVLWCFCVGPLWILHSHLSSCPKFLPFFMLSFRNRVSVPTWDIHSTHFFPEKIKLRFWPVC